MSYINAIGRRKTAVARVYLFKGSGKITVNDRDYKEYFPTVYFQQVIEKPFKVLELEGQYDVKVNLKGGGIKGQAEALSLAIARALCKENPDFRPALKAAKLLTRDPREVERKKPGQPKARKKEQYSKR